MAKPLNTEIVKKRCLGYGLELLSEFTGAKNPIILRCSCGNIFTRLASQILCGNTRSCGCYRKRLLSERSAAKLDGRRFGKLTVVKRIGQNKHRKVVWQCLCDCGKTHIVCTRDLTSGDSQSCGCWHNATCGRRTGYEEISGKYWYGIVHGASRRKIGFNITIEEAWNLFIKQERRCAISGVPITHVHNLTKNQNYHLQTASLDRIDSSKGYTIDNVQWVHKLINKLKWTLTTQELLTWIKKIYEYNHLEEKDVVS